MALVDTDLGFLPTLPFISPLGFGSTLFTFDGANDLVALICQIPKTGTIDKVHFRIAARSSPVMTRRCELRTVDMTTGLPNAAGTLYGSSTSITADASLDSANTNVTAAVNCTGATKGDIVAVVFDLSAFTSGNFQIQEAFGSWTGPNTTFSAFPYVVRNTGAGAAVGFNMPNSILFEYSGATFVPFIAGGQWCGTQTGTTITNSGTVRAGNKFTPKTKRRAVGIACGGDFDGGVVLRLRLASDDSILATATLDKDTRGFTSSGSDFVFFDSGTTVTVSAGTTYYVLAEGTDATGGSLVGFFNAPSAAALDAMPGGQNCFAVTHNGTSYTNTTTGRYEIGLITDQEDDGTGGGGMIMSRVQTGM